MNKFSLKSFLTSTQFSTIRVLLLFSGLLGVLWACGGGGGGGTTIGGTVGGETGTRIAGRVVDDAAAGGVQLITVQFFNAAGTNVGQATTNATGNYQATVSQIPTRLHIQNGSINAGFYKQFFYRNKSYSTIISSCKALVGVPITVDVINTIPNLIMTPSSTPPPPPPNGCQ